MKNTTLRILAAFTPAALLFLWYSLFDVESLSFQVRQILWWSPFVVFIPAVVISSWFHKSRAFFVLLMLMLHLLPIYYYFPQEAGMTLYFNRLYPLAAILLPLNILVFSLIKERGIFTLWGSFRFAFILLQGVFILQAANVPANDFITATAKNYAHINIAAFTPLPQLSILAFALAFVVLVVKQTLHHSYIDLAFTGTLGMIFLFLQLQTATFPLTSVFFAASGIMLLLAVIQESFSMAFYDQLTGLPSRRYLEQDLMKLGVKYTIAMLDIDHFKKFNDKYGHDVGDEVLRFIASMIRNVGGRGKAYRYGGEEFTVVFPGKNVQDAVTYLEDLREKISARGFILRGKDRPKKKPAKKALKRVHKKETRVSITVSIGVAEKNNSYKTPHAVIKAADAALYRAKGKGRNCISR